MKKLLFIFAALFIFASCSKDDDSITEEPEGVVEVINPKMTVENDISIKMVAYIKNGTNNPVIGYTTFTGLLNGHREVTFQRSPCGVIEPGETCEHISVYRFSNQNDGNESFKTMENVKVVYTIIED